jgi:MurNAc alpha-1-phosphate uridylyltransferase
MILAAGRGERLGPLTDHTPKPLLEIHGEPLIVHQLRWLKAAGITEVVINLHHLGAQIEAVLGDGARFDVTIRYSHEQSLLDTGGGIRQAQPLLGEAPFAILNGDIWTDFEFSGLPASLGADLAHLVLTDMPAHRDAGDFDLQGDRVRRDGDRAMVYCGISVLSPALFDATGKGPNEAFSLRDLLFEAAAQNRLGGERFTGTWIDIGSPEQLEAVRLSSR